MIKREETSSMLMNFNQSLLYSSNFLACIICLRFSFESYAKRKDNRKYIIVTVSQYSNRTIVNNNNNNKPNDETKNKNNN